MIVRLILLLALFVIAMIAITTAMSAFRTVEKATTTGDAMPQTLQRVAYVLLIALMLGICSGLLGAV